jgi:DNA-binding response OmpR family regulator
MEILRKTDSQASVYRDAHLTLDFDKQAATLDFEALPLTRKEYDLLALLVSYAGMIVPRSELLLRVWGYGDGIRTRTLDVHIRHLRKKLGMYADEYIETVFGIGHRFQPYDTSRRFPMVMERPVLAMRA